MFKLLFFSAVKNKNSPFTHQIVFFMKYEEHIDWGMKIVKPFGGGSIFNNFCLSSLTVVNLHGFINAQQNT